MKSRLNFRNIKRIQPFHPSCRKCRIKKILDRKNLILQEVNHRIKNNLQILSSILNMQIDEIDDLHSIDKLNDCVSRIKTIALLHEKLNSSNNYEKIDLNDFIISIIVDLYSTFNVSYERIKFKLEVEHVFIDTELAIPCGLILNELITNSFKYAFPDERSGHIFISFKKDNGYMLMIKDDGIGMNGSSQSSLGLSIIKSLTEQINGKITTRNVDGVETIISFPESTF